MNDHHLSFYKVWKYITRISFQLTNVMIIIQVVVMKQYTLNILFVFPDQDDDDDTQYTNGEQSWNKRNVRTFSTDSCSQQWWNETDFHNFHKNMTGHNHARKYEDWRMSSLMTVGLVTFVSQIVIFMQFPSLIAGVYKMYISWSAYLDLCKYYILV